MPVHLRSRLAALRARLEVALPQTPSLPGWLVGAARAIGRVLTWVPRTLGAGLAALDRWRARRRAHLTYRDDVLQMDATGLQIHRYYYPLGRKRIAFDDLEGYRTIPLTGMARYRVHGWGYPRRWYHRDARRSSKEMGLELDTGRWLQPVITPVEPYTVLELLEARRGPNGRAATGREGRGRSASDRV